METNDKVLFFPCPIIFEKNRKSLDKKAYNDIISSYLNKQYVEEKSKI